MTKLLRATRMWLFALVSIFSASLASASVSLTSPTYSENFDNKLGTTPFVSPNGPFTSSGASVPGVQAPIPAGPGGSSGWDGGKITGSGNATTTMPYTVSDGSGTNPSGGIYNFGATAADTERALGSLSSGTNTPAFGVELVNNTTTTFTDLQIAYIGEFWRSSTSTKNVLTFGYFVGTSGSTTYLSTSNGVSLASSLDLQGPAFVGTNGALNGNDPGNQISTSGSINNINWAPGASLYIRWQDKDDTGSDAGLAVDNFSLTALSIPPIVWTGNGSDNNWSTGANWLANSPPTNGAKLLFTGSNRPSNVNNSTIQSATVINFDSSAGAFTLNGTGTGANLSLTNGINNNSSNPQTLNLGITTSVSQSFTAATGDLIFNGPVAIGATDLTAAGASAVTFAGGLSGTGRLLKTDAGAVNITGTVNSIGSLRIGGGTVNVPAGVSLTTEFGDTTTTAWDGGGLSGSGTWNLHVGIKADNSSQGALQLNSTAASSGFSGPINITGAGEIIPNSTNSPLGTSTLNVQTSGLQIIATSGASGSLSSNNIVLGGSDNTFKLYVGATRTSATSRATLTVGSISGTGSVLFQTNQLPSSAVGTPPPGTPSGGGGGGNIFLSAASTYTGDTTINLGNNGTTTGGTDTAPAVIKLLVDNALPVGTNLTMGTAVIAGTVAVPLGGQLDLNNKNQEVASLASGVGAGSITNGSVLAGLSNLKISGSANTTFGFPIQDGAISRVALERAGTGTTILTGTSTYTGDTKVTSGKLQIGKANVIADTSNLVLAGGTFSTGGFSDVLNTLTVSADSKIDIGFGGASTLKFSPSGSDWTATTLTIDNWTNGSDHLFIGADANGLVGTQLSHITFTGYGTGATIDALGEIKPNSTLGPQYIKGDVNFSGSLTVADLPEMLNALTNLPAYRAAHPSFTDEQYLTLLDINQDGKVSNSDIQGLLNLLAANGFGSVAAVPEPATYVLLLGAVAAFPMLRRRGRHAR